MPIIVQQIPGLFQGISKQPANIRLPGQHEDSDNAVFSVESSGFSKRNGSQSVATLTALGTDTIYHTHWYKRDASEQYLICIMNGLIRVFDLDGVEKTVTYAADTPDYITETLANNYSTHTIGDSTIIVNKNRVANMATTYPSDYVSLGYSQDVPTTGSTGQYFVITGGPSTLDNYTVKWDGTTSSFIEAANPLEFNNFDLTSMPHLLKRNQDGTFTLEKGTWDSRAVGDNILVPIPDFIGSGFNAVSVYRNRLVLLSGEQAYFSQADDYFNLWPDYATQVIDSDPVTITATGSSVAKLETLTQFRRKLLIMSSTDQYEIGSGDEVVFSPSSGTIASISASPANVNVAPTLMGSFMYFVSDNTTYSVVSELYIAASGVSELNDVTKHVIGFLPTGITQMTADPITGTLMFTSSTDQTAVYVYKSFLQNDEKVQSAWGKWSFGGNILALKHINNSAFMVIERSGVRYLEKLHLGEDIQTHEPYGIRLDRRQTLNNGVYTSGTDTTAWTVPYTPTSISAVVSTDFGVDYQGSVLSTTLVGTTLTTRGDYSGTSRIIIGEPYTETVTLSAQYVRGQDGKAVLGGRLALRKMELAYRDTGYFEVQVTPQYRDTATYVFDNTAVNITEVGPPTVATIGTFVCPIYSTGNNTVIKIVNSTPFPSTITSAQWTGLFSQIGRTSR